MMRARLNRLLRPAAAPAAAGYVPTPQFYWKLNDSVAPTFGAVSLSSGAPTYGAGKYGNGLYSAAESSIGSNEVPILTGSRTGSFAASAWFKAAGVNLSTSRIFQSDGEGSDLLLYLDLVNGVYTVGMVIGSSFGGPGASVNPSLSVGMHHVAAVSSGGVARLYLNGVVVASVNVASLPGAFGDPYGDFGVQAQTEGVTDDVAVWVGTVPTPAQIAAIAAAAGDLSTLLAP